MLASIVVEMTKMTNDKMPHYIACYLKQQSFCHDDLTILWMIKARALQES